MNRLVDILTHCRPAGSTTEKALLSRLFDGRYAYELKEGNIVVIVGQSETLFSCHTDTVHSEPGQQKLLYDKETNALFLDKPKQPASAKVVSFNRFSFDRGCLGADDGAGMWLMLEMIDAKVPGTYVFHHSEECGGIGSHALSSDKGWLSRFKRAIAFDRKGTGDIIMHQRGGRCCSDTFVTALAAQLGEQKMPYKGAHGSFTDTANYTDTIPECTNLSCGYYNEHTESEWLDLNHLLDLRKACIALKWEELPTERNPKEKKIYPRSTWEFQDFDWNWDYADFKPKKTSILERTSVCAWMTLSEIEDECRTDPEAAAKLIWNLLHHADQY